MVIKTIADLKEVISRYDDDDQVGILIDHRVYSPFKVCCNTIINEPKRCTETILVFTSDPTLN